MSEQPQTDAERLAKIEAAVTRYRNATPPIVSANSPRYVFGPGTPDMNEIGWLVDQLKAAQAKAAAYEGPTAELERQIEERFGKYRAAGKDWLDIASVTDIDYIMDAVDLMQKGLSASAGQIAKLKLENDQLKARIAELEYWDLRKHKE